MRTCLHLANSTSIGPGNDVINRELLCVIPRGPKRDDPEHLIVGIEGERGVQNLAREEAALLRGGERTLASKVGRSCLYLRADSLLVKISLKLSAESARSTLEDG